MWQKSFPHIFPQGLLLHFPWPLASFSTHINTQLPPGNTVPDPCHYQNAANPSPWQCDWQMLRWTPFSANGRLVVMRHETLQWSDWPAEDGTEKKGRMLHNRPTQTHTSRGIIQKHKAYGVPTPPVSTVVMYHLCRHCVAFPWNMLTEALFWLLTDSHTFAGF